MRARIKQNPDLLAVMTLVFATVILYSLWGGMILRAGDQASNTVGQAGLATNR